MRQIWSLDPPVASSFLCRHCHHAVETPHEDPTLLTDTKLYRPHRVAFHCPRSKEIIRLDN
jgi:hypothetical protein